MWPARSAWRQRQIVGAVVNGGTIAAGNSIGTLSITGPLTFDAGSTLEVEVDPAGQADLVDVTGTATINGGTVSVLAGTGTYAPSTLLHDRVDDRRTQRHILRRDSQLRLPRAVAQL